MRTSKLYLVISMVIFGSIGLFVKNIDATSSQIALIRGVIGSSMMLGAGLFLRKKISWKAIVSNLFFLIGAGAALGFNWIYLFEAYQYTTIANATLSYYFAPIFVMILAPLVLRERIRKRNILCILGAMVGMFFVMEASTEGISTQKHLLGIGFGLLAAVLYASVIILNKFLKGLHGVEVTLIQLLVASIVLLPYVIITQPLNFHAITNKSFLLLLLVGVIHTGIAYLLYFVAIQNLKGQTIALYSYIDPIAAILLSGFILGESMTVLQAIGAIFILGSTYIGERINR